MIPRFEDFESLLSAEQIAARVRELGKEISRDLHPASDVVVVGVLKGSIVFMADLIRTLPSRDHVRLPARPRPTRGSSRRAPSASTST